MRLKKKSLLLIFGTILLSVSAQNLKPTIYLGTLVQHEYYSMSYVEAYEQPEWTFHMICAKCFGDEVRKNNFRADPKVTTRSSQLMDYKGSGFDRGHLVPAADMTRNEVAMSESFYMSNMSPQNASFNRGVWRKLEGQIRELCNLYDTVYVVSGPIIEPGFSTIGINQVVVPQYYFKAVYINKAEKMMGFILPNEGSSAPLSSFRSTIDDIEMRTGLDLFSGLEDEKEAVLESKIAE